MSVGIDYGHGQTNINHATGIRFGVISQHSVLQAWADSSEADYGKPHCPRCGNEAATDFDPDYCAELDYEISDHACADYACHACQLVFDSSEAFGDEPIGYSYTGDGYQLVDCLDSDIMVLDSPYYTKAAFCSPCCPGACSIESPHDGGARAYCLGHDWFENGRAPYPVYDVTTGREILPDALRDFEAEKFAHNVDIAHGGIE